MCGIAGIPSLVNRNVDHASAIRRVVKKFVEIF